MSTAPAPERWYTKFLWNRTLIHGLQINALRAISLGIGFLGSIWSSRCLGPDKLGVSGMIIGTIAPMILIMNLNQTAHFVRLYRGKPTEDERAELVAIISTYKIAASVAMMLIAIPLIFLGNFSPNWHLALLAGFPFFFLTANAADWLLQGQDNMPAISRATTIQALLTTCLFLIFFRPGVATGSDLVVQDIGLCVATSVAWYTALKGHKVRLFQFEKLRLIVPIIVEGRWLIATGFAVYIFTALEVPLIGWLYSLKEVGIYRTSIVLVGGVTAFTGYLPMLLYPRMIEWYAKGPHYLWERQKKVIRYYGSFALVVSAGAFLLSPIGYHYIYGPAFQKGAYPFAFLLSGKLIAVMNGTLGWGLLAQKRDRDQFNTMIYVCIFSLTANLIFIPLYGAYAASSINMLSEILMFTLFVRLTLRSLKNIHTAR